MLKVNVKWGKKKFDNLDLNLSEPPVVFKTQLFTLSGVLPERQKIMVKGGILKDDADWNTLGIKDGHTFMMMGSAEADIPKEPTEKTTFVEDMTDEQAFAMKQAEYPAGLSNLGNTCYMNATLQCLRTVPELSAVLKKFSGNLQDGENSHNITVATRDLFNLLTSTNQPIPPLVFLQVLRSAFPQFAQKGNGGIFMQQDAEECWSQILHSLNQKLPRIEPSNALEGQPQPQQGQPSLSSSIAQLFAGQLVSTTTNTENPEEPKSMSTDVFYKLICHISATTNYLGDGLKAGLEETLTKASPTLNKDAQYLKSSRISRLPFYLTVQFMRFFWKPPKDGKEGMKAKIVRPVEFPFTLDLYDLCSDDLKAEILPNRKRLQEMEDQELQQKSKSARDQMRGKEGKAEEVPAAKRIKSGPEEEAQLLDPTKWTNPTARYELVAVLTHKGRAADSGHYVAWVKQGDSDDSDWLKYDDDVVSPVPSEEIKKLSGRGGGDWHMAYLCLYKSKPLPVATPAVEEGTATATTTSTTTTTDAMQH